MGMGMGSSMAVAIRSKSMLLPENLPRHVFLAAAKTMNIFHISVVERAQPMYSNGPISALSVDIHISKAIGRVSQVCWRKMENGN